MDSRESTSSVSSELLFDPADPEFRLDPVPAYKRLLAETPVFPNPRGGWILSRHAHCMKVLESLSFGHDPEASSEVASAQRRGGLFVYMDPPDHTRLRGLVAKAFTLRTVEQMRPRIQRIVDDLIDEVERAGSMELIADFAYPLPVTVITEMLGVRAEDRHLFGQWTRDFVRGLDPQRSVPPAVRARQVQAGIAFRDYCSQLIESRRTNLGDDLISELIKAEEAGDRLTKEEMLATLTLLLIAGHETTVNLVGNGILQLMRHRKEWDRVVSDASFAKTAVEEILRFDPPVLFVRRRAVEDTEIDGVKIAKGDRLTVVIGAANRDPDVFPDPHRLDAGRQKNPHITFGLGIHFCLGAPLARIEGQIAFATLARRLPNLALDVEEPEYREHVTLRGLAALPVRF